MERLISDLAICIVAAWLFAVVARLLGQPLLLAYLAAGFVVGPVGLGFLKDGRSVESISKIGLILLLFLIGLEIDLKKIARAGKLIVTTAVAQVGACIALGVVFFQISGFLLGDGRFDALYLAVGAAFSSTVIIVKLLTDKNELDTLPGRITLGIMVLQDLFTILFLAIQPSLNQASPSVIFTSFFKVSLLLAIAFTAAKFALPPLFKSVARQPELILIGAISWCLLIAGVAGSFHLSMEMGALVAGVAISTFPYSLDISSKLTSLRDFFVTLFFVSLGMAIPLPTASMLYWAAIIAAWTVLSRLITVFLPLHFMKQGFRASLLPGINLAQISELSLVIFAVGSSPEMKHISPDTQGMIAYAFVFLGVLSTYGILKGDRILAFTVPLLKRLGLRDYGDGPAEPPPSEKPPRIYLLGFYLTASSLLEEISRHSPHLLPELAVVDFNPNTHRDLRQRGVRVMYGDITQRDTLLHTGIDQAEIIICTLPNSILRGATNRKLLAQLRELNPAAKIFLHAERLGEVPSLYEAGADYVSVPRLLEARELREAIDAALGNLLHEKRSSIEIQMRDRNEVIP